MFGLILSVLIYLQCHINCVCMYWHDSILYPSYRNSSLSKFFDQFFAVLSSLRNERDHATLMALAKRKVDIKDPVEMEYVALLTPYALGFVSKQLALRNKVAVIHESATYSQVTSSEGVLKVTAEKCECTFWNSTHLPCRHMLAIREKKGLPLFDDGMVARRWTLDHMKEVYDHKISTMNPESFQVHNNQLHMHVFVQ